MCPSQALPADTRVEGQLARRDGCNCHLTVLMTPMNGLGRAVEVASLDTEQKFLPCNSGADDVGAAELRRIANED